MDNNLPLAVKELAYRLGADLVGIANIEQARQPMYTTGGADRSGMGFTIMESFMTNVDISSAAGKGTTVHMRRKLQRRK